MSSSPVIQATIWSGRRHCQAEVVRSLRWLDYDNMNRLWLVHDPQQLAELQGLSRGMPVHFVQIPGPTLPQYSDRRKHREAVMRGFLELWPLLTAMDGDVLLVEDDIEVPANTITRLAETAQNARRYALQACGGIAVSGVTRCSNGSLPLFTLSPSPRQHLTIPVEPTPVDGTGMFCFYLPRTTIRMMVDGGYQPAVRVPGVVLAGKDLHLCWWLKQHGGQVWIDPAVRCNHHCEVEPGRILIHKEMTIR